MVSDAHNNAEVEDGGRSRKKRPREMKMIDVKGSGFEEDNKCCCCCCRECGKMFGSPKALYGHMRCHPERWWRGINQPSLRCDKAVVERSVDQSNVVVGAGCDDDHEVADCLLMLSNGRNMVSSERSVSMVSAGFLDLNVPAPVEQVSYSVCSSSSLNLELIHLAVTGLL